MAFASAISEWARNSPAQDFWVIALLAVVASLFGILAGFYYLTRKRILENIPTSKIRSAAQGYLELIGRGQLLEGPPIISPLTGNRCTWFSYRVEERRGSGKNTRWDIIETGISDSLFLILDETGQCVIDPDGASVIPAVTNTWYGTGPRPQSGPGIKRGIFYGGSFRYIESRMHAGDSLYAIGLFKTVGGASAELNANAEVVSLLKEWKNNSNELLQKFDRNRDGQIDAQEWEKVRDTALQEVLGRHREFTSAPAVNLMSNTHDLRQPYILSALSQQHLIQRYTWYSAGFIALFFLAGGFACVAITARLLTG